MALLNRRTVRTLRGGLRGMAIEAAIVLALMVIGGLLAFAISLFA